VTVVRGAARDGQLAVEPPADGVRHRAEPLGEHAADAVEEVLGAGSGHGGGPGRIASSAFYVATSDQEAAGGAW
jgi:hypothetical protein